MLLHHNKIQLSSPIIQESSTGIFTAAHSSITVNDKIYLGERTYSGSKIIVFNDLDDLSDYTSQTITGAIDFESVCYNESTNKLYFTGYDNTTNYYLYIVEVDPDDISSYTVHQILSSGSPFLIINNFKY